MFRLLISLGIVLQVVYGQLPVEQCGLRPLPISVFVPGCTTLPCDIQLGGVAEVEIAFNVGQNATYINPSIFVDLGNDDRLYFDLPEEFEYGCNFLTVGECPLIAGQTAVYSLAIPFYSALEVGSTVTIQFTIYDDNENTLSCFRAGISIV